jgi:hypothetical protein
MVILRKFFNDKIKSFYILLRNIFYVFIVEFFILCILKRRRNYILGLLLGNLFCIFKLFWMEVSVRKACQLSVEKAKKYFSLSCLIRQSLTLISFFFVFKNKNINAVAFCIGLLSLKISGFLCIKLNKKIV